jgi:effector-binding domain-containing protein
MGFWKWIAIFVGLAVLAVAVGLAAYGGNTMPYESPDYRVTSTLGPVEIREYEPYLVAETTVDGNLENAGNQGFRILAKYIFGANQGKKKIAMTAPVSQERQKEAEGTKIAMTTPVTQEREGGQFTIRFMMPSEFSRDELPVPNDDRVAIVEVPSRTFAAVRYSGRWTKRLYEKHLGELYATLRAEGLEPEGEPVWARYNPPFTPWFMRRNEILTEFREASGSD